MSEWHAMTLEYKEVENNCSAICYAEIRQAF